MRRQLLPRNASLKSLAVEIDLGLRARRHGYDVGRLDPAAIEQIMRFAEYVAAEELAERLSMKHLEIVYPGD